MPQSTAVMAIPIVEHWKKHRRQDLRLPRLRRRLRRGLAQRHHAAGREGRHQAGRRRALRAHRHQRHRPGAEARRRPTPTRSSSSPPAAARRCRTRAWSSAATQGQDLPDARRGDDGPDPRRRRRRRGLVRRRRARRWSPSSCPTATPSKALGVQFKTEYEKAYGKGSANQFAAHAFDVVIVLREGGADRAEEGQAGHAGVPRRAEGRVRDDGPHAGLAGRAELDRRPTTSASRPRPACC